MSRTLDLSPKTALSPERCPKRLTLLNRTRNTACPPAQVSDTIDSPLMQKVPLFTAVPKTFESMPFAHGVSLSNTWTRREHNTHVPVMYKPTHSPLGNHGQEAVVSTRPASGASHEPTSPHSLRGHNAPMTFAYRRVQGVYGKHVERRKVTPLWGEIHPVFFTRAI